MMLSSKMNYCCHRTGEPLRTNGSPWIIAPRVKGSAASFLSQGSRAIVLRIPRLLFGGHLRTVAPGAEKILLGVGR